MKCKNCINVLISDDEKIFREDFADLLEDVIEDEINIFQAEDINETNENILNNDIDILFLDISYQDDLKSNNVAPIKNVDGLDFIPLSVKIKPKVPILIVTNHDVDSKKLFEAIPQVQDYIKKENLKDKLVESFKKALNWRIEQIKYSEKIFKIAQEDYNNGNIFGAVKKLSEAIEEGLDKEEYLRVYDKWLIKLISKDKEQIAINPIFSKVLNICYKIKDNEPSNIENQKIILYLYRRIGKHDEAIQIIKDILKQKPHEKNVINSMKRIYSDIGDYNKYLDEISNLKEERRKAKDYDMYEYYLNILFADFPKDIDNLCELNELFLLTDQETKLIDNIEKIFNIIIETDDSTKIEEIFKKTNYSKLISLYLKYDNKYNESILVKLFEKLINIEKNLLAYEIYSNMPDIFDIKKHFEAFSELAMNLAANGKSDESYNIYLNLLSDDIRNLVENINKSDDFKIEDINIEKSDYETLESILDSIKDTDFVKAYKLFKLLISLYMYKKNDNDKVKLIIKMHERNLAKNIKENEVLNYIADIYETIQAYDEAFDIYMRLTTIHINKAKSEKDLNESKEFFEALYLLKDSNNESKYRDQIARYEKRKIYFNPKKYKAVLEEELENNFKIFNNNEKIYVVGGNKMDANKIEDQVCGMGARCKCIICDRKDKEIWSNLKNADGVIQLTNDIRHMTGLIKDIKKNNIPLVRIHNSGLTSICRKIKNELKPMIT